MGQQRTAYMYEFLGNIAQCCVGIRIPFAGSPYHLRALTVIIVNEYIATVRGLSIRKLRKADRFEIATAQFRGQRGGEACQRVR